MGKVILFFIVGFVFIHTEINAQKCPDYNSTFTSVRWLGSMSGNFVMDWASETDRNFIFNNSDFIEVIDGFSSGGTWTSSNPLNERISKDSLFFTSVTSPPPTAFRIRPDPPNVWRNTGVALYNFTGTLVFHLKQMRTLTCEYEAGLLQSQVLPVTYLGHSAKRLSNNVNITWSTASEQNNNFFSVERSTDGKSFDVVGQVKGNGTTSSAMTYNFIDSAPLSGSSYYRLKQVDFDGKHEYSPIVAVAVDQGKGSSNVIYMSDKQELLINTPLEAYTISISDMNGKIVKTTSGFAGSDLHLSVADLASGVYVAFINGQTLTTNYRFSKF